LFPQLQEALNNYFMSNAINFSKEELARYNRHIIIPEFGLEAQQKLKAAKVLVVGSGGLGSPVLLYLAAAGVGNIGIVDFDVVDDSNLQRQVLFGIDEIGKPKVEAAKRRLQALNPHINITLYNTQLTSKNALELISQYDIVADGTDNFPTRYLVNDASVLTGKPNVYASIFQFEGQVSVFNYTNKDGQVGPNYRDLYPTPPRRRCARCITGHHWQPAGAGSYKSHHRRGRSALRPLLHF
jgi:sulfur-carrier protein adenylyltransferase/sulfurtransferase